MRDATLKPVLVLLTEGFADWEASLLGFAVMDYGLTLRHASIDGSDVTSLGGMRVTGLQPFAPTGDEVVVVCGGMIWEQPDAPDIAADLRAARSAGAPVGAICGGVAALARSGMLEGVRHVSNGRDWLRAVVPGYAGAEGHVDRPQALTDGGIITAAGSSPVSFAAEVLSAAGLPPEQVDEMRQALAAEHQDRA